MHSKLHLDFETRSRVKIQDTGAWHYAEHPSTRILCVAYALNDEPVTLVTQEDLASLYVEGFDQLRAAAEDPEVLFCAHNSFFEYAIWHNIMVPLFGMPEIGIKRWRCTAAKASACDLPRSLAAAAIQIGLDHKKDGDGRAVMLKLCKPRGEVWINKPELFEKLYKYCIQDVEVERALDKRLPELNAQEQVVWFLDQKINTTGILIDKPAVETALKVAERLETQLTKELYQLTDGKIDRITRHAALKKYLNEQGLNMKSIDKTNVSKLLKEGMIPDRVRRILEIKQELGRSSLAKYSAIARSLCRDGRIRDHLMYHGAGTGRWSGKLVQLQNLPSRGLKTDGVEAALHLHAGRSEELFKYPSVSGALAAAIRSVIVASPEHKLIVADYSSIEARIVLWLAECQSGISMFRQSDNGEAVEVYLRMAQMLYEDDTLTKEANPVERNLGKQIVLGCGYGMGVNKFHLTCQSYGMDVDERLAEKAVRFYRDKFPEVCRLWMAQEQAAIYAVRKKARVKCGKVIWFIDGPWLVCQLPSGRQMRYFQAELRKMDKFGRVVTGLSYNTIDSQKRQSVNKHLYGGLIVENICQATARDIMALAMIRVQRAGYNVLFTVHDEIIAEHKDPDIKQFCELLTRPVDWAQGLPLTADGWVGDRYKKG